MSRLIQLKMTESGRYSSTSVNVTSTYKKDFNQETIDITSWCIENSYPEIISLQTVRDCFPRNQYSTKQHFKIKLFQCDYKVSKILVLAVFVIVLILTVLSETRAKYVLSTNELHINSQHEQQYITNHQAQVAEFVEKEEKYEFEDTTMFSDFKTQFVPSPTHHLKERKETSLRYKRNLQFVNNWKVYMGNKTTDFIIWTASSKSLSDKTHDPYKFQISHFDKENKSVLNILNSTEALSATTEYTSILLQDKETIPQEILQNISTASFNDSDISVESALQDVKFEEDLKENSTQKSNSSTEMNGLKIPGMPNMMFEYNYFEDDDSSNSSILLGDHKLPASRPVGAADVKHFNTVRKAQSERMQSYMDSTANPCVDFYKYACGNWEKQNPIPKDQAGYDTFEILRETLDEDIKQLLEEPIGKHLSTDIGGDAIAKAKLLYISCMNHEILQKRGSEPLRELLSQLGGWPILNNSWNSSHFNWVHVLALLKVYNNDIFISEWIGPDIKYSNEFIIQFDQTTLGLPSKEYFLDTKNEKYLNAYRNFIFNISLMLGAPLPGAMDDAEEIVAFEVQLAAITTSPEERHNISDIYKKMTLGKLQKIVPQINWIHYMSIVTQQKVSPSQPCVMYAMNYVKELVKLLEKTPRRTISNYMLWRFVRHRINNLDDSFEDVKQHFYSILFGREEAPPRWKNCVTQVNNNMGMAVGAMFVRKYFDDNSKRDTLLMTESIMKKFRVLLQETTWIDEETKTLANEKIDVMQLKIGYPDSILDTEKLNLRYNNVVIQPNKYFENTINILTYLTIKEQNRLGKTVNKSAWNTAPAVVNAYYSRNKNQIMFPAGILQPPFYHRFFPRSINYGGIGVVIGHEITHGFDDKGRLFDKEGNLHRWWHDSAVDNFHLRAQCLIDQYSRYIVKDTSVPVDGIITQGENIADNGGVKQAFMAYKQWLSENDDKDERLEGFYATNEQLFFINFAQVWCGHLRPEASISKIKTAVHAPGKYRVIGTLCNSVEFADVFKCKPGTPMNPVHKCAVW